MCHSYSGCGLLVRFDEGEAEAVGRQRDPPTTIRPLFSSGTIRALSKNCGRRRRSDPGWGLSSGLTDIRIFGWWLRRKAIPSRLVERRSAERAPADHGRSAGPGALGQSASRSLSWHLHGGNHLYSSVPPTLAPGLKAGRAGILILLDLLRFQAGLFLKALNTCRCGRQNEIPLRSAGHRAACQAQVTKQRKRVIRAMRLIAAITQ